LELPIVPDPILLPKPAVDVAADVLVDLSADSSALYEEDFFRWTQMMADALRSGDLSQLDRGNLAEEIESLGRNDRRAIESRLTVLLMHLLKWQVQPEMRSGSWRGTIVEQRTRIRKLLQESPSLRSFFASAIDECYGDALVQAVAETGLPIAMFPIDCPYAIEAILNVDFLPD
jgi:hypothetical protein